MESRVFGCPNSPLCPPFRTSLPRMRRASFLVLSSLFQALRVEKHVYTNIRGWKLNNWNTIIHYSLLFFSRLFIIHFTFFRDIRYSFFSFYVSFPFQIPFLWITCHISKEVTTVILSNFWLYHKGILLQKWGTNLESKQYTEFILSEISTILYFGYQKFSVQIQPYL